MRLLSTPENTARLFPRSLYTFYVSHLWSSGISCVSAVSLGEYYRGYLSPAPRGRKLTIIPGIRGYLYGRST